MTGDEMFLSADAETVARELYERGASFTSGHRDIELQAEVMAENIVHSGNRRWIADTYLWPGPLQVLVDEHPEAYTVPTLTVLLHHGLHEMTPDDVARLSHHLRLPCAVFDLAPYSVTGDIVDAIEQLQKQGRIVKALWKEGGLDRCHVECAHLPLNKVVQV